MSHQKGTNPQKPRRKIKTVPLFFSLKGKGGEIKRIYFFLLFVCFSFFGVYFDGEQERGMFIFKTKTIDQNIMVLIQPIYGKRPH